MPETLSTQRFPQEAESSRRETPVFDCYQTYPWFSGKKNGPAENTPLGLVGQDKYIRSGGMQESEGW